MGVFSFDFFFFIGREGAAGGGDGILHPQILFIYFAMSCFLKLGLDEESNFSKL